MSRFSLRRRYTRWVAEAFFFSEVQPWAGVYNIKQVVTVPPAPLSCVTCCLQPFDVFGYTPDRWAMDILIAFAIGTVYRIIALPILLWHSRSASTTLRVLLCGSKK